MAGEKPLVFCEYLGLIPAMESIDVQILVVEESAAGQRLDKFLSSRLPEFSRNRVQGLLAQGMVTLAGQRITDAAFKVKPMQAFHLTVPPPAATYLLPQVIALDIIYEDQDLLVINKKAGLTVHPAPGNADHTLVNALLAHCSDTLSGIGGVQRPGIVHRIDKNTSGLLVVAKHDMAHNALSAQLADRSLSRTYQAICWGIPKDPQGTIKGNIGRSTTNRKKMAMVKTGGKSAVTHYRVLENVAIASLMECTLETGRTHQIRVHMTHLGHPLIGDPTYGQSTESRLKSNQYKHISAQTRAALLAFRRQALHAIKMGFIHPRSGKSMEFHAPLPADMADLIDVLRG